MGILQTAQASQPTSCSDYPVHMALRGPSKDRCCSLLLPNSVGLENLLSPCQLQLLFHRMVTIIVLSYRGESQPHAWHKGHSPE